MKTVYLAIDGHARHSTLGCMSKAGKFERSWTFNTTEKELMPRTIISGSSVPAKAPPESERVIPPDS